MIRKIIQIDEDRCNGCGLCADACQEGAIEMVNNKARLTREDYCDGLGNCLPVCPADAITFVEKEAEAYDAGQPFPSDAGCPGSRIRQFERTSDKQVAAGLNIPVQPESMLRQWPVQIKLAPVNAPYFDNADLLVAADCTAYAYADFHNRFIRNRITLIGCPKLDDVDYTEKLTEIISRNNIKSLTIVRMEVPCCGGLQYAAENALKSSGKFIPWQVVTLSTDGNIID